MNISRLSLAKLLELAITVCCVGIHYSVLKEYCGSFTAHLSLISSGTFVGFLIILVALFSGHLLQTPSHKRIDAFLSVVAAALFITTGALIFDEKRPSSGNSCGDKLIAEAVLSIINGAIFLFDGFLIIRD